MLVLPIHTDNMPLTAELEESSGSEIESATAGDPYFLSGPTNLVPQPQLGVLELKQVWESVQVLVVLGWLVL